MRVALGLEGRVVADVDLAADERLDALLRRVLVVLHRAGERPVVGEPDGGHLELGSPSRERGDPAGPVEDRVLGVDVQVDEGRLGQGVSSLGTRSTVIGTVPVDFGTEPSDFEQLASTALSTGRISQDLRRPDSSR